MHLRNNISARVGSLRSRVNLLVLALGMTIFPFIGKAYNPACTATGWKKRCNDWCQNYYGGKMCLKCETGSGGSELYWCQQIS
jgi:hypothetical protein